MSKIKEIIETLNQNQELAQKLFEIETSVLSILNFEGSPIRFTVSYGLSHMEDGAYDAISLLKKADKMLYRAKMEKNTRYSYL
jgi:GGDEF domain-containing protein